MGERRERMAEMTMEQGPAIPTAQFIEDVGAFLEGKESDTVIKELQEKYQQCKLLEAKLLQTRVRLQAKLPDIKKALDAVELLLKNKEEAGDPITCDFELSDGVYAKAKIDDVETVQLWLGANVMLDYPLQEARDLLARNLANCKSNLERNKADTLKLKDSIPITEVSMARIYNHDVSLRKK